MVAHLLACRECRQEVEALVSMQASLHKQHGSGHVKIVDLVAYEDEATKEDGSWTASLERHLMECQRCAADLESLRAVRRSISSASPAPQGPAIGAAWTRKTWWGAAALLAAALVSTALWVSMGRSPEEITLMPARRGAADPIVLAGAGPWRVKVVLPAAAPEGRYVVRFERADGTGEIDLGEAAASGDGPSLSVTVPALSSPGFYRLVVRHQEDSAAPDYLYGFSHEP